MLDLQLRRDVNRRHRAHVKKNENARRLKELDQRQMDSDGIIGKGLTLEDEAELKQLKDRVESTNKRQNERYDSIKKRKLVSLYVNAEHEEETKAASDTTTLVDCTSTTVSINDHPFIQKLLSDGSASKIVKLAADGTMKKVLIQYFVKDQSKKILSQKFLDGLTGCDGVTRCILDKSLKMMPDLHAIAKTVIAKHPLSKERSHQAQGMIHYWFPST